MTEAKTYPPVLDACCGSRMIWFDKADPRCLYVDNRRETWITDTRPGESPCVVNPDTIADFTSLPFPDGSFSCVVFDPPHFSKVGDTSRTARKYGKLPSDWRDMLRRGFAECFRVLRPDGVLLFKWCEFEIPLTTVLALTDVKPLVGNKRPRTAQTHWIAFLKPNDGGGGQ